MQLGMIGLGRMGRNMVRRLMQGGHECVVYNRHAEAIHELQKEGATGAYSVPDLIAQLSRPRVIWAMVPAGAVEEVLGQLIAVLHRDDIIIDGGNSHYLDDVRRAQQLQEHGLHYVDVGTSGGIAGRERGYCLMIGGDKKIVQQLTPIFTTLAPGIAVAPRTLGRHADANQWRDQSQGLPADQATGSTAEQGYLHCGAHGAGHFVKMVHNGIEYGVMAAYAEGLNLLHQAAAPLTFSLPDIVEVWRRGSVLSSWLLDLTAEALLEDADLDKFSTQVADSGEGRWATQAALELGVPVPVISAALFSRFGSRGNADYAARVLSAMRNKFGGHDEPRS